VLSGVGQLSTYGGGAFGAGPVVPRRHDSTADLSGEIRRDKIQLDDWITCVSANTPKGKSEIQSLSARISAAKEHIARIQADEAATPTSSPDPTHNESRTAQAVATTAANAAPGYLSATDATPRRGALLNIWA